MKQRSKLGCALQPSVGYPESDSSDSDEQDVVGSPGGYDEAVADDRVKNLHSRELVDSVLLAAYLWLEHHCKSKYDMLTAEAKVDVIRSSQSSAHRGPSGTLWRAVSKWVSCW
jgi:hypothetical protein